MSIRKLVLLFLLNLSILILPVAYAEANIEKININTADVLILENLRGIGPKKAADIVEFRDKNGMFESIDDLKKINGIGQKTIDKNRELIEVALIPEEIPESEEIPDDSKELTENSSESNEGEKSPSKESTDKDVIETVETVETVQTPE